MILTHLLYLLGPTTTRPCNRLLVQVHRPGTWRSRVEDIIGARSSWQYECVNAVLPTISRTFPPILGQYSVRFLGMQKNGEPPPSVNENQMVVHAVNMLLLGSSWDPSMSFHLKYTSNHSVETEWGADCLITHTFLFRSIGDAVGRITLQ